MTTAAQNIPVFLRKSPLLKEHFFEWLKTANFSTACETATLKSPLLRAFFVSDVHLRPRKHFSRCTLDCGFKTSESPALRGFVGGLRALATAALYLVLKSNGLHRPKIRLKKFGFSLKTVPANIAKKLPSQTLSQTVSHRAFQLRSQTAHVRSHSRKRVHTRLSEKNRTQGHTRRNRWHFGWGGITTLGAFHTFRKPCVAGYQNGVLCRFWALVGGALEEHRKPSEQRCAYARRCSEASRPRWAA